MVFIVFIFGLAIGSFLNAWIWRSLPHPTLSQRERGENISLSPRERGGGEGSVWRGRSRCPKCKKVLRWYELIPIVSFVIQFGRCRGCKQKIDWQYPMVELCTGILFMLAAWNLEFDIWGFIGNWKLVIGNLTQWYLLSVLVILFVYDLRYGLVPELVVLPAIAIAFVYNLFSNSRELENSVQLLIHNSLFLILSIIVGASFFAAQYYFSKGRWLGAGDICIGALMGAMLGWPLVVEGLVVSYIMGGAVGIMLLAFGKKKFGQTVPLGTFLTLGTAIVFLYGEIIWRWYWQ